MVPSHAIKVVKGKFVHLQPQTPVCNLASRNYALNTSFYEFLLVLLFLRCSHALPQHVAPPGCEWNLLWL